MRCLILNYILKVDGMEEGNSTHVELLELMRSCQTPSDRISQNAIAFKSRLLAAEKTTLGKQLKV